MQDENFIANFKPITKTEEGEEEKNLRRKNQTLMRSKAKNRRRSTA